MTELQSNSRMKEIEIDTQSTEERLVPVLSQPTAKRFNAADMRSGVEDHWSFKCVNSEMFHDGVCQLFSYRKYDKEGHFDRDCNRTHEFVFIVIRLATSMPIFPFSLQVHCRSLYI